MNSQRLRSVPSGFQERTPMELLRGIRGTSKPKASLMRASPPRERPQPENIQVSTRPYQSPRQPESLYATARNYQSPRQPESYYTSTRQYQSPRPMTFGYYDQKEELGFPLKEERFPKDLSPTKRVMTESYLADREYPPAFHNYFQQNYREAIWQIQLQEIRKIITALLVGVVFTFIQTHVANLFLGNGFVLLNPDNLFRITILSAVLITLEAYVALAFEYRVFYKFYLNLLLTNTLRYKRIAAYLTIGLFSYGIMIDVQSLCERRLDPSNSFLRTLGVLIAVYHLWSLVIRRAALIRYKIPLTTQNAIIRSLRPKILAIKLGLRGLGYSGAIVAGACLLNWGDLHVRAYEIYRYIITTWIVICHIQITLRVYKKLKSQPVAKLGYIFKFDYPLFIYGLIRSGDQFCMRASLDYLAANLRFETQRGLSFNAKVAENYSFANYKDNLQVVLENVSRSLKSINSMLESVLDQRGYYRNRYSDNIIQSLRYLVLLRPRELEFNFYFEQVNMAEQQCDLTANCFVTLKLLEDDKGAVRYDGFFKDFFEQITLCKEKLDLYETNPELAPFYAHLRNFHTTLNNIISMLQVYMKKDIALRTAPSGTTRTTPGLTTPANAYLGRNF